MKDKSEARKFAAIAAITGFILLAIICLLAYYYNPQSKDTDDTQNGDTRSGEKYPNREERKKGAPKANKAHAHDSNKSIVSQEEGEKYFKRRERKKAPKAKKPNRPLDYNESASQEEDESSTSHFKSEDVSSEISSEHSSSSKSSSVECKSALSEESEKSCRESLSSSEEHLSVGLDDYQIQDILSKSTIDSGSEDSSNEEEDRSLNDSIDSYEHSSKDADQAVSHSASSEFEQDNSNTKSNEQVEKDEKSETSSVESSLEANSACSGECSISDE